MIMITVTTTNPKIVYTLREKYVPITVVTDTWLNSIYIYMSNIAMYIEVVNR